MAQMTIDVFIAPCCRIPSQGASRPASSGASHPASLARRVNQTQPRWLPTAALGGVRCLLDEAAQREALTKLELTDLWGIARRLATRLSAIGITTPLELRDADHRLVRERFSVVLERMVLELRGVACIALEGVTPDRKSLIDSRSFGQPVETRRGLEEAVSVYTARAAEKMRRQNLATASLAVWIETNGFKPQERQYSASKSVRLSVATADTGKLIAAATAALRIIFKQGYRYNKAGVTFLELVPAGRVQRGLFDQPDDARSISRMHAVDELNARFGRGTIGFGTAGERQVWSQAGIHLAALHNRLERAVAGVGQVATPNANRLTGFHRRGRTAEGRKEAALRMASVTRINRAYSARYKRHVSPGRAISRRRKDQSVCEGRLISLH